MYFVYLDESGDSRFKESVREESDFFILGGVIVKEKDLQECDKKFKEFKQANLPEELWDYPIHAVELNQMSKYKETKYKEYLTDIQGKELLEKIYSFINELPIEAIAVIIDTYQLKKRYPQPKNPYFLSYEILIEKVQKIVEGRTEPENTLALINLSRSSEDLARELKRIHNDFKAKGTRYKKLDNIVNLLNIEDNKNSSFYEIADLVCYAFRRSYYSHLCKNLKKLEIEDNYLFSMKKLCTLNIGHFVVTSEDGKEKIRLKIFPEPRYLEKETK